MPAFLRRNWPIIAVAAVYLVALSLLPLNGIWINDVGNRIIQLKSIVTSGYSDYSLDWAGRAIDPDLDYAPITYPFAVVRNDKLFSVYSPFLATVASPFFRAFGYPGLYILPLLASLVMLAGLARIVGEVGGGARARALVVLVAGLATPIWFYSLTFWEHTIAVACCVWSVLYLLRFLGAGPRSPRTSSLVARPSLVAAAALSALAIYFRPELYSFSSVLLVTILARARGPIARRIAPAAIFVGAAVAAIVPLWIFQWATVGSPFGFHIGTLMGSTSGLLAHLRSRPLMFFSLFCLSTTGIASSIALAAPFLALFFVRPRVDEQRFASALTLCGLAAIVISIAVVVLLRRAGLPPVRIVGSTNSLFPTAPVLMLGLIALKAKCDRGGVEPDVMCVEKNGPAGAGSPDAQSLHTLWLIMAIYAVIYWLAAPQITRWGIHWGNRYLLVLYPLIAVPCAMNLARWPALVSAWPRWRVAVSRAILGALVAASIAAQIWSITILDRKMDFSSRFNSEVGKRPEEAVIGTVWWVGQELYGEFDRKLIFFASTPEQFGALSRLLSSGGYSSALIVLPAGTAASALPPGAKEVESVSDNGLGYWSVDLFTVPLRSP